MIEAETLIGNISNDSLSGSIVGIQGPPGVGISTIEKTNTIGLIDYYTITYTDGSTSEFEISNGSQGIQGIQGESGVSPTFQISKTGKITTVIITDVNGSHTLTLSDGADGTGAGDMLKSVYDTNDSGVVDNAEKVNNHTVDSDVPINAKFTDTTYTAGTGIDINNGIITNTQTSAEWGNVKGTLSNQTDLQNALNSKVNTSDLSNVATSGSYNDLSNTPTIPTVNDATLIIQKNGSTIDTFTANSSTNKTINVTVPTAISDLTNDLNFVYFATEEEWEE